MKIFISQPMTGRTTEEILKERNTYFSAAKAIRDDVKLIDSFAEDCEDESPIYLLGQSVSKLAFADLVIFVPGWEKSRGCQVEHKVVDEYHIKYIEL